MIKAIRDHLNESGKTYWQHTHWALKYGFILIWAGITSLIHAIFPLCFKYHSAKTVLRIAKLLENHPNINER